MTAGPNLCHSMVPSNHDIRHRLRMTSSIYLPASLVCTSVAPGINLDYRNDRRWIRAKSSIAYGGHQHLKVKTPSLRYRKTTWKACPFVWWENPCHKHCYKSLVYAQSKVAIIAGGAMNTMRTTPVCRVCGVCPFHLRFSVDCVYASIKT